MRADEIIRFSDRLRPSGWEVERATTEIDCNLQALVHIYPGFQTYAGGKVEATTELLVVQGNQEWLTEADWAPAYAKLLQLIPDRFDQRYIVTGIGHPELTTEGQMYPVRWTKATVKIELVEIAI